MLDGFGGIHTSDPDVPRPPEGLLFEMGFDFARNLEIVEQDGELTFILLDRFGGIHKVGPGTENIQIDAPWFGVPGIARDLEATSNPERWWILDGFGLKYDTYDFAIEPASDAFWVSELLAKGLAVLPNDERILIDAWGGLHASDPNVFTQLHSFENTPFIPGFDIFWDIEILDRKD